MARKKFNVVQTKVSSRSRVVYAKDSTEAKIKAGFRTGRIKVYRTNPKR
jgi:hypothetical protein